MNKSYVLFFFLAFLFVESHAQEDTIKKPAVDTIRKDSVVRKKDTIPARKDTTIKKIRTAPVRPLPVQDTLSITKDSIPALVPKDTLPAKSSPDSLVLSEKKTAARKLFSGKEALFYYLVFVLLLFGLLRQAFPKYFYDLFRVFFRTTIKQKQ